MELYRKRPGVQTRWSSFENPGAEKGRGATTNRGAKGCPCDALPAGSSRVLVDVAGSGTVCRIWLTIRDRSPEMLRSLRLDMTWDNAATPAVSVPLGDFFGVGLGRRTPFECELFSDPEGRSFNCFIPMPFRSSARITITNESARDLSHLFYDIDFLLDVPHDDNVLYFHAHWRRESPNALGEDFVVLPRVQGTGRYLGSNIGVITDAAYGETWWGEGEFKVWLDGDDQHPTLCGTGTEDFIGGAWGQGVFCNRTQGCLVADRENRQWAFFRYHTHDPIYFAADCRTAIQTIGGSQKETVVALQRAGVALVPVTIDGGGGGKVVRLMDRPQPVDLADPSVPEGWCNFYRQDDWSACAYFYMDRPENGLPALAPVALRTMGLIDVGDG